MQQTFVPLVRDTVERCKTFFGGRLAAFYLHGSIAQGDAIAGLSDLDAFLVIEDEIRSAEQHWIKETANGLQLQYKVLVDGVHLTVCSVEDLKHNDFARFALKYNATLLIGRDVVSEMRVALPDGRMARGRLAFARECFQDALAGRQPGNTGSIPSDTWYAARKFARYFVIIEGAYFLMAQGAFVSFDKHEVLAGLRMHCPAFQDELDATEQVLADAQGARIAHADYLRLIEPMVIWMFDRIAVDSGAV